MDKATITIPTEIRKGEELIAIPRLLFEEFSRWKKEEEIVDRVIVSGEAAFKKGKTIIADSSKDALRIFHGREKNR